MGTLTQAATSRLALALLLAAAAATSTGCSFEQDPATTVTLEITGISGETDRDAVQEKLKGMTDGSGHSMTSTYSGDKYTVNLSPVSDVDAFAEKIDFGEVTDVSGRTLKVTYRK